MTALSDEVADLPGSMDLDPAKPRLCGASVRGPLTLELYDTNWQFRSDVTGLSIGPNATVYRGTTLFLVGLAIVYAPLIEYVVWRFIRPADGWMLGAVMMPLPSLVMLGGAGLVWRLGRSERAKGPIFRYSADDRQFHLFRIDRTVPRSQVVRLDLVTGAWARDSDSETFMHEGLTELHLVVRLKGAKVVSFPMIGTQGKVRRLNRGLGRVAKVLSEMSGVPLERVDESTSFFDPYPRIKDRLGHGLCPKCGFDMRGNSSGSCPRCDSKIPM